MRWLAAALALAVVAIAVGRMTVRRETSQRPGGPAAAYVDTLGRPMTPPDRMNALTAYQTGVALARAGLHTGSLPYFRRALELRPDLWQVHCDYAASLVNSGIEVASLRGKPGPTSRSSIERVAGIREALAHLKRAERLAGTPEDRVHVVTLRARHLAMWGLGWDAFEDYRLASGIGPVSPRLKNETAWHVRLLRDAVEPGK